ncbi:aminotransferase class IV, partial [Clostridium sp. Sa3CUN1]
MRRIIFNEESIEIDSGFFFGKGVFETILVKNKAIFLSEHIERLNKSIRFLNIGEKISEDKILELIEKFNIKNCVLKIIVTERNLVLSTRNINYKTEDYLKGFSLKISEIIRNSKSKLTYIKS